MKNQTKQKEEFNLNLVKEFREKHKHANFKKQKSIISSFT